MTGVITVLYPKALKPKALPRRARGRTGQSPVPSCFIQSNTCCTKAAFFRMNAKRWIRGVEQRTASFICAIPL
ncbi:MAG: hypothetical protein LBV74_21485 [Tannerella sp.]|jgi:hypothetical protein|nr:hypothetical protein [Tannerella sp.]